MWNKIKQFGLEYGYLESSNEAYTNAHIEPESVEEAFNRAEVATSKAQHTVNRALAHYCEHCDRGFSDTGACKMHKRFKHKNV